MATDDATDTDKISATQLSREMIATANNREDQIEYLLKLIEGYQKIKLDYLASKDAAATKRDVALLKVGNDIVSARTKIISAVNSGAYAADKNAAQRDLANLRDNYAKLSRGYSARSNDMVNRLQSQAAMRSPDSPEQQRAWVWQQVIDQLDPADPALPFTLRAAERILGGKAEAVVNGSGASLLSPESMNRLAMLRREAANIDGQRERADAALADPTKLGLGAGGMNAKAFTKSLLELVGDPPPLPSMDPVTEADVAGDEAWKRIDYLDHKYERMLDSISGNGDGSESAEQDDQMASIVARPAFQEWAQDHGYHVGTSYRDAGGVLHYSPGKDDGRAVQAAARQMQGRWTPFLTSRGRNNTPDDYLIFNARQPSADSIASLRGADGKYTVLHANGQSAYVSPHEADDHAELPEHAVEWTFAHDGQGQTYAKGPDGTIQAVNEDGTPALDDAGKSIEVPAAIRTETFVPFYKPDGAPVSLKDLSDPEAEFSDTRPPTAPPAVEKRTTPPDIGKTVQVYGKRLPRHPLDPTDSIRVSTLGGEHLYVRGADGGMVDVTPPGGDRHKAWDYSSLEMHDQQYTPSMRERVARRRGQQAYDAAVQASAHDASMLPEAADKPEPTEAERRKAELEREQADVWQKPIPEPESAAGDGSAAAAAAAPSPTGSISPLTRAAAIREAVSGLRAPAPTPPPAQSTMKDPALKAAQATMSVDPQAAAAAINKPTGTPMAPAPAPSIAAAIDKHRLPAGTQASLDKVDAILAAKPARPAGPATAEPKATLPPKVQGLISRIDTSLAPPAAVTEGAARLRAPAPTPPPAQSTMKAPDIKTATPDASRVIHTLDLTEDEPQTEPPNASKAAWDRYMARSTPDIPMASAIDQIEVEPSATELRRRAALKALRTRTTTAATEGTR